MEKQPSNLKIDIRKKIVKNMSLKKMKQTDEQSTSHCSKFSRVNLDEMMHGNFHGSTCGNNLLREITGGCRLKWNVCHNH